MQVEACILFCLKSDDRSGIMEKVRNGDQEEMDLFSEAWLHDKHEESAEVTL